MRPNVFLVCCAMQIVIPAVATAGDLPEALRAIDEGATETGMASLHTLADANDPHAELALYVIYDQGLGAAASPFNALLWLRRAAEHGLAAAQAELGDRYYFGRGLAADKEQAKDWWRRAARQGVAAAQYNLAAVLRRGDATEAAEAANWFRAATAAGYTPAPSTPEVSNSSQSTVAAARAAPLNRDWVLAQPATGYTIHIATGADAAALAAMLTASLKNQPFAIVATAPAATPRYLALYGSFADRASAEIALAALPDALRFNAPLVRHFAVIRQLLGVTP